MESRGARTGSIDTGKRRRLATIALAALSTLPSGCRIPAIYSADPGPALPQDFNGAASVNNSADLSVDEFFSEPALSLLINEGLSQNFELKIRNQEIQVAANEVQARRGAYLPFVNIGARGGVDRTSRFTPLGAAEDQLTYPGGGRFPDPLPNVGLQANLFWQLDYLKQLRNARDAAIFRYCEAIEARDYLITAIVTEIASSYYELAALDQRLVFLNQTIDIQSQSLDVARAQKDAARGTELGVQRFLAEVRKNESQRLIIKQQIIEVENRINVLTGRYPQMVNRQAWDFIALDSRPLEVGVPAQLLQNRRDIRAAEREVAASGLDVLVARANFYPKLAISGRVGYEAFNPRYLFDPGAFVAGTAGELVAPLFNKKAIRADYQSANARQLAAIYNYQRTVVTAFTEVVNNIAKVDNYRKSVAIKQEQVKALESSVDVATQLFQAARPGAEYIDVLFAQRDLLEARTVLIETKQQQLSAIVKAYQSLGGGLFRSDISYNSDGVVLPELPPLPEHQAKPPADQTKASGKPPVGVARLERTPIAETEPVRAESEPPAADNESPAAEVASPPDEE